MEKSHLKPLDPRPLPDPLPPRHNPAQYCIFHQQHGHPIDLCYCLHHEIQDLINNKVIALPSKPNRMACWSSLHLTGLGLRPSALFCCYRPLNSANRGNSGMATGFRARRIEHTSSKHSEAGLQWPPFVTNLSEIQFRGKSVFLRQRQGKKASQAQFSVNMEDMMRQLQETMQAMQQDAARQTEVAAHQTEVVA
ncbi:hypothetical protein HYC85_029948 [Camellia sinensis]|uniref:Uncharacterized protein n=1 Tax=Camellia sinensis TaxID=4442 RepID=A0A7J7G010_CAMSI|nr:hypothetical protein HYC85_029948 [Camellia sinensis]